MYEMKKYTMVLFSLMAISESKEINMEDTIELFLYSIEKGLDPIAEYKKAFF